MMHFWRRGFGIPTFLAGLVLLLLLGSLGSCVVRNTRGEVDQEATRTLNQNISSTLRAVLEAGTAIARDQMEREAERKRRRACHHCEGRGLVVCGACNGHGYFQCAACRGRGHVRGVPCRRCNRTGRLVCTTCQGRGQVSCPRCRR